MSYSVSHEMWAATPHLTITVPLAFEIGQRYRLRSRSVLLGWAGCSAVFDGSGACHRTRLRKQRPFTRSTSAGSREGRPT
jgi:hypothetical protein